MNHTRRPLWRLRTRTLAGALVLSGLLAACGGGSSASGPDGTAAAETSAPLGSEPPATDPPATDPPATAPPATEAPATTSPPPTTPELDSERPEGAWTMVRRLESTNVPYDGFQPGDPVIREWVLTPTCASGPCDIEVGPGDDGDHLPDGFPADPEQAPSPPLTMELQPDGSYEMVEDVLEEECYREDNSTVPGGTEQRQRTFRLRFVPAENSEPARLEGTMTNIVQLNDKGRRAGCVEYRDEESLVAQRSGAWSDVDVDFEQLTLGDYVWGGTVVDGDERFLEQHPLYAEEWMNSDLSPSVTCDGGGCSVALTEILDAGPTLVTNLDISGNELAGTRRTTNDCVVNDSDPPEVVTENGYRTELSYSLRPAIIVDGELLALTGRYGVTGTPTAEARRASPEDCYDEFFEYAIVVATSEEEFGLEL